MPSISACGGMRPEAIHWTIRAASMRPYPLVGSNPGPVGLRWVVTSGRPVWTWVLFGGPFGGAAVAKSMSSADMVTSWVISLTDSGTGWPVAERSPGYGAITWSAMATAAADSARPTIPPVLPVASDEHELLSTLTEMLAP